MKKYIWLGLIVILGIALRFWHNTDVSLWHDEAFSALLIKYNWGEMLYRIGLDVHPPMYYIFLRFWSYIFGDSLLALRGMSIFFGVGTIVAGYGFVKEAFKNEKAGLVAALLLAVNPFQLQYVTEARMYTMGAFFGILAAYFITKALRAQHAYYLDEKLHMPNLPQDLELKKSVILNYAGFAASIVIIMYTHYYLLFTAAAVCLYALAYHLFHYRFRVRRYWLLLSTYVIIALAYLPWLKWFMYQYKQVGAGYWIPPMDRWSIPTVLWHMLLGIGIDGAKLAPAAKGILFLNYSPTGTEVGVIVATIFTLFFLVCFLWKTQSFEKWLVFLGILAPFGGAILFFVLAKIKGSDSSVFLLRYFIYCAAFFTIALAVWFKEIRWKWLSAILIVLYVGANLWAYAHYWNELNVKEKPGMAAAAKFLAANVEPSHKLYVGTSFEFFNLKYYWSRLVVRPAIEAKGYSSAEYARPLLYSGGQETIANMPHFAGTAILTNADLIPSFDRSVKKGDIVWILWTNAFGANKPEVPANWKQIDEKGYQDVRPYAGTWIVVTEYRVE